VMRVSVCVSAGVWITTAPEEDRAAAIDNKHRKIGEAWTCVFRDMPSHISENHTRLSFSELFVHCVRPWLGSVVSPLQCYLLPVLWMTSYFHIMAGKAKRRILNATRVVAARI